MLQNLSKICFRIFLKICFRISQKYASESSQKYASDSSRKHASEYFGVSEHLIQRAQKLKSEKGILPTTDNKTGRKIPDFFVALLQDFFQDDKFSRIMPGKKEHVNVKGLHNKNGY